ncbi:MAG: glutamate racemase [Spongiibacteraceae bacterium]|nr:glutamate racemase [Spongiibacteraceae bacterium]
MSSTPPEPVLIFDSGVGGLSIHAALTARLPGLPLVYACDNAAFPYGPWPQAELVERVHTVLDALIARYQPQLVVVACNTASTVALPRLRQDFKVPFVGVVPAIKPAARLSRNRIIGLLATPGTVSRPYTDQLIADFAADCTVVRLGSTTLVEWAETKLRGRPVDLNALRQLLAPLFAHERGPVDTVVLGCTHFPLLVEELQAATPEPVLWVDSGNAIARRVETLLGKPVDNRPVAARAVFTARHDDVEELRPALAQRGFGIIEFLPV